MVWELDSKEGWVQKNQYFDRPLDCKEAKSVHPKGNQSWIFIGRTDAESEAPVLCPPVAKSQLIGKDPEAGKDWRQKEKKAAEDELDRQNYQLNGHESEQTQGDSGISSGKPGIL